MGNTGVKMYTEERRYELWVYGEMVGRYDTFTEAVQAYKQYPSSSGYILGVGVEENQVQGAEGLDDKQ